MSATPGQRLGFWSYRLGLMALRALPTRFTWALARALAGLYFDLGGKRVRFALANLRIVYPERSDAERRAIGRESFQELAVNVVDLARSEHWSLEQVAACHEFEGREHLDAALARGKGAILLVPHMGNFELSIRMLSGLGYRVTAVAREMRNPLMRDWVWERRREGGNDVIDHRRAAPGILRALKAGRLIPLFNDQYQRRSHGVWAPFFGKLASCAPGVAVLAQRSGAPIVPACTHRIGPDRHHVVFLPAIEAPPRDGDPDKVVAEATEAYNRILEEFILAHPTHWMWSHRRWRHSPDVEPDLYA